jgi:uncharacterized protein YkwD
MRIARKFKNQVFPWMVLIMLSMTACMETPKIEEISDEEVKDPLLDFDKELLVFHLNQLRSKGCQCAEEEMPPVAPLKWNSLLSIAAQKHAEDMHENNFFDHLGSDLSTVDMRVSNAGFPWKLVGENIARGNFTEESIIEAWKESPTHCVQLMHADFLVVGVGKKENYWTMVLAR